MTHGRRYPDLVYQILKLPKHILGAICGIGTYMPSSRRHPIVLRSGYAKGSFFRENHRLSLTIDPLPFIYRDAHKFDYRNR